MTSTQNWKIGKIFRPKIVDFNEHMAQLYQFQLNMGKICVSSEFLQNGAVQYFFKFLIELDGQVIGIEIYWNHETNSKFGNPVRHSSFVLMI